VKQSIEKTKLPNKPASDMHGFQQKNLTNYELKGLKEGAYWVGNKPQHER